MSQIAQAKGLPTNFLNSLGVRDSPKGVQITYLRQDGSPCARQRLRTAASAKNGSLWQPGEGSPEPYGLWKLVEARKTDQLIIVEGESDTWTLWYHNVPALGIPGASMWRSLRFEHLEGIYNIYIHEEPDEAGSRFAKGIAQHIKDLGWDGNIYKFSAPKSAKDISELHLQNQENLPKLISESLSTATNLTSNAIPNTLEVRSVRKINAAELKKQADNNPTTLAHLPLLGMDGFFVHGWSHILAGYPKTGKTELIAAACQLWSPNKILFISEEPESIWKERLKKHDGDWAHVTIMIALGIEPDQIKYEVEKCEESIVIIDTTRNLLGLQDENNNSEVANTLLPYIAAARQDSKTPIFLHHTRKSGGDHGHAISGAHAFLGTVDIALQLSPDPQAPKSNRRFLQGWGRINLVPELLYEMSEEGLFIPLGEPQAVALEATKERVLEALSDEWQKTKEVQEQLDEPQPSGEQVRRALTGLAESNEVARRPPVSEGKKRGQTYQWRLVNETTPQRGGDTHG